MLKGGTVPLAVQTLAPLGVVPPNYRAELIGVVEEVEGLGQIEEWEQAETEGQLMLSRIDFGWRFPLFEQASGLYDWELKREGVEPWPGYDMVVFYHPTEPIWYVAWVKGSPWWQVILAVLLAFFASWVGQALAAVFLGALIYRVIPEELRKPLEEFLGMLPPIMIIAVMGLLMGMVPRLAPKLAEKVTEK